MSSRILVIEDNADNRELMTYLLEAFGHRVATAVDGAQALTMLNDEPFDLIVCDVHLPRVDGFEIVEAVKASEARAGVPIVAVTALAMVGDRDRLLAAGFDAYIGKPIEPQEFMRQIEACIAAGSRG